MSEKLKGEFFLSHTVDQAIQPNFAGVMSKTLNPGNP